MPHATPAFTGSQNPGTYLKMKEVIVFGRNMHCQHAEGLGPTGMGRMLKYGKCTKAESKVPA